MDWHFPVGRLTDPAPQEFAKWAKPGIAFATLLHGVTQQLSDILYKRLCNGRLYAAAAGADWIEGDEHKWRGITSIDPRWWLTLDKAPAFHSPLWQSGDISLITITPNATSGYEVDFSGVRFEHTGLEEVLEQLPKKFKLRPLSFGAPLPDPTVARPPVLSSVPAAAPAAPLVKHPGGKPPLTFWEDAVLAVAHEIHKGNFKPMRPADVQRMLADWIVSSGYDEPGPTALKERAAKVFKLFGE
jgi:hypothetical protein